MKKILVLFIIFNFFSCSLNSPLSLKKAPVIGDTTDTILNHSTWGKPKNKKIIVLLTRQHPPETTGYYAFQSFLETILDDSELSDVFLKTYRIIAFPIVNPDGVDLGHWRHNYGGIENLSLIPGNVGATPIQNIGAYGVEIKDTFVSCEAMKIDTQEITTFDKAACKFGYRESVFKADLKNQYVIVSVVFKLTKKNHQLNTSYGAIDIELENMGIKNPTIQEVSKAVIAIRESKLPNPKELGNSGSFFKNPIVSIEIYEKAKANFPDMPHYPVSETLVKVPAGWLIEQAGFKGKRFGDAGIHTKQALVLVNYGNATGNEIWNVAQNIQRTILEKYGISIEAEVNVI